ncbi:MAG: GTP-binding protein [Anaerolineaceae bacterium]|nr:GTP-binding protein [Anaerolineaceae bacterium]
MTAPIQPTLKEQMNIVFVGHVDHGKSTVVGRLLADTKSLPEGKLEQVRARCERESQPFEYAYLIDALKEEQSQSITIDSARVFFQSQKRHYIIIDAPGHIEFIKNMVTGASRAEAAVLVIDAKEGVQENSRRHGYLLWMLGIKQIVVLINKMDLVDYQESVYNAVRDEYTKFLNEIGVEPMFYIPVSGKEGDNVSMDYERMPWYRGETVLSALDSFRKASPPVNRPFRMPVQDIYKFTRFGDDRRLVVGSVSSGQLNLNDEVIFYPSGKSSTVKSFEAFAADHAQTIHSGQSVSLTLDKQIYISRGEIACRAGEEPPRVSKRLRVSLVWLGEKPMVMQKQYFLKLGTTKVRCQIEIINQIIDASDYSSETKDRIEHHDVAECILSLHHPIAFDLSETLSDTSRFVIVDDYEIRGGGIVLEDMPDEEAQLREAVFIRERKWIRSAISMSERAERYNQRPSLIIITGKRESRRKLIASELEKNLFNGGKFVYYVGIGSIIYGVDADIKTIEQEERPQEHMRRMAEVAHIFLDAGLILIVTAQEVDQDDINIIRSSVGQDRVEVVWSGDEITTNLSPDLQIDDDEEVSMAVTSIKSMLQEHGIIFMP